ncbi:hypothetical protein SLITO_v1c09140 [Spiroplasma litorale]|uniref:Uncharacterized protein n=1 Tax=Spiroplasma litorale TaxID=216942 RepID=A0A0K1W2G7_9MOLU|nr:hypothetical protein [Spiroplasma litorale]AKX34525.1 hypothetical protein SLITO_v1c09140 [Spiroplasma litorale]
MQNNEWLELVESAKSILKNFSKKERKIIDSLTDFGEKLVKVSSSYEKNRTEFLNYVNNIYVGYRSQATRLLIISDCASMIMQLNDGLNDSLILINIFKDLVFLLDELKAKYLNNLLFFLIDNEELDNIKMLIVLINNTKFGIKDNFTEEVNNIFKKNNFKKDTFYEKELNKDFWKDINLLNNNALDTFNYGSNFIKETLSEDEGFEDDMIINIWAILAINICYLDYLNNLN